MLIWDKGTLYNVSDNRIEYETHTDIRSDVPVQCEIFIDGLYFTHALAVYVEHKQYQVIESGNDDSLYNEYRQFRSVAFIDSGVRDSSSPNEQAFIDYTEKAREGVRYFNDVITPEDRDCTFKDKYINVGVRL